MDAASTLYQLALIAAFVGTVVGAIATFKRAPRGKRWLGAALVAAWAAAVLVVPFLVGIATGAGLAPDPARVRGVLAVLFAAVAAFGFVLWRRFRP